MSSLLTKAKISKCALWTQKRAALYPIFSRRSLGVFSLQSPVSFEYITSTIFCRMLYIQDEDEEFAYNYCTRYKFYEHFVKATPESRETIYNMADVYRGTLLSFVVSTGEENKTVFQDLKFPHVP
ncbi:hypothetical protein KQX54_004727 [Cotesia glomerata]|uniref:Uncharacterized protein n=1 Tax=Cotesia glomerata TaxID=32391 RepID=A0AAV7I5M5_COTGL|nr:hypothetical protein KQX54_004727 [Cotesia glomerata]